jgi:hypothetical protein
LEIALKNSLLKYWLIVTLIPFAAADETARGESFDKAALPFFQKYCLRCHGEKKQKSDFRIDTLSREFSRGIDAELWVEIITRLNSGEMPPKKESQPSAIEVGQIVDWLSDRIKEGEAARMARRGRVAHYRLSREEYANTVYDLLGVLYAATDPGALTEDLEFGPDSAFACDLRDDAKAEAFLKANKLEEGKFLCCLSRLRFTPYWTIPSKKRAIDPERHEHNEKMKEHDHAALRESIIAVVRETDLKVLLCPEDMTQVAVGKEMLWDKLPNNVKERVVWREKFWLTDEALSTYVRSAGLFGSEMHSPIMAVGNGIPAIVCRFKEQTSKGFMWHDIGLGDWLFDLDDESDPPRIKPAVLDMTKDSEAAKEKVKKTKAFVRERQRMMCEELRKHLL